MNQAYETRVGDEFVMVGNDVLIKCDVPGFAADFLEIVGWSVMEDGEATEEITGGDQGTPTTTHLPSADICQPPSFSHHQLNNL